MGLSASQARMLMLYARKSDLEYRGQVINQQRLKIAWQTEQVAKDYSDKMSNRVLQVQYKGGDGSNVTEQLTATLLKDKCSYEAYYTNGTKVDEKLDPSQLEQGLRDGTIVTYKIGQGPEGGQPKIDPATQKAYEPADWKQSSAIKDNYDTTDDAAAEAQYTAKSAELQSKDKQLEVELKNIDTQHQAVQTEVDAVKKVIDKNIEMSFKTFSA